ncbi:MAG: hypothetical protein N2690_00745, partial [Rhodocyclaceae bacterium]|nr:hypothetical protein [Rhodocyclaceae bacterium]
MAQHDYQIADQPGASFLADLNAALAAIVSQNSGATEPSPTYAYQWWADTASGKLKLRNAANSAWIEVGSLGSPNLGLQAATTAASALAGLTPAADRLPYFTSSSAAALAILTSFARTILDDPDAPTARATLGAAASGAVTSSGLTMGTGKLLGRTSAGTGAVEELSGDQVIGLSSGVGFRNKIIGGDFTTNPWQRGTSFTNVAGGLYTADRWVVERNDAAAVNVTQAADAPTAEQAGVFTRHSIRATVTTADTSISAGKYYFLTQRIEGLNAAPFGFGQSGTRHVTLSFWVKATKTGTYCVSFRNGATNRSYVAEYTVSASNTWERKTITIPVDTAGTWLYDNGIGLRVDFIMAAGSTFQTAPNAWAAGNFLATSNQVNALDAVNNIFALALVQLEAGQTATPFETRSAQQELALCQR